MGLMARNVEVANAEREVDRIEILERGREINEMRDQRENRERANEFSQEALNSRPALDRAEPQRVVEAAEAIAA